MRAWKITQITLFILPIIVALIMTPYQIAYDEGYVNEVTPRVLDNGTNFEGAVEDWKDTEGAFYDKQFKLEHKELYYLANFGFGLLFGCLLQIFNLFWSLEAGWPRRWDKE